MSVVACGGAAAAPAAGTAGGQSTIEAGSPSVAGSSGEPSQVSDGGAAGSQAGAGGVPASAGATTTDGDAGEAGAPSSAAGSSGGPAGGAGGSPSSAGAGNAGAGGAPKVCPSKWATEGCGDALPTPCEAPWTQWTVFPGECLIVGSVTSPQTKPGAYVNPSASDSNCSAVSVRAAAIKVSVGGASIDVATALERQYGSPLAAMLSVDAASCAELPEGVTLIQ